MCRILLGNFSGAHAVIRDLEVRIYRDPQIGGIDLEWVQQCRVETVIVNTGVYNVQAPKPTHDTKHLITPAINCWGVEGNVGISHVFPRNGGASILARRIGSGPAEGGTAEENQTTK